jgi:hypothetical protein
MMAKITYEQSKKDGSHSKRRERYVEQHNRNNKKWYASNRDKVRGNKLCTYWPHLNGQQALVKYHGVMEAQNGVCAICRKPESTLRSGVLLMLAVDHDHKTGQVRGLLCNNCNRAEGLLGTIENARSLIAYMELYAKVVLD